MKFTIKSILLVSIPVICLWGNNAVSAIGTIDVMCDGQQAVVTGATTRGGGKYVGFSAKLNNGTVKDYPHKKIRSFGGGVADTYRLPRGVLEVRASTWKGYNKKTDLMIDRQLDSGWVSCR